MTDNILRIQATIEQMQRLLDVIESIGKDLPRDPRLHALLAEAPLELLSRMHDELEQYFEELKQVPVASAS